MFGVFEEFVQIGQKETFSAGNVDFVANRVKTLDFKIFSILA